MHCTNSESWIFIKKEEEERKEKKKKDKSFFSAQTCLHVFYIQQADYRF